MDIFQAIIKRRSYRSFSSRPIEFEKLSAILEAGALAPTAANREELRFIVINNKKQIKEMSDSANQQFWIDSAPVVIVVCSQVDFQKDFFDEKGVDYAMHAAGASVQNMLLAATAVGLGACWVGNIDESRIKDLLHIPENIMVPAIIPLGYPDKEPDKKEEMVLARYVYFHQYGNIINNINLWLKNFSKSFEEVTDKVSKKANPDDIFEKLKNKVNKFLDDMKK